MPAHFKSIRNILLTAGLCSAMAQQAAAQVQETDTLSATTDTLKTPAAVKDSTVVRDSTATGKKRAPFERQFRLGADIYRPIASLAYRNRYGLELMADYTFREDKYLVLEAGYGGGKIDYDYLKYNTRNTFVKLGIDVSMFDKLDNKDWDIIFVGFRYGMGIGQRGPATFTVTNPFGSPTQDQTPARNYWAHWGEITAGMRFELLPRFFAGWNVRAKFFLNANTFDGAVAPNYIAGYGTGDKSTSFDFNFYCAYAIRWYK